MAGHSSHSSPFPTGVNSSSTPLAPVNSTVVHSQNTAQQLVYYRPQVLSSLFSNFHVNDVHRISTNILLLHPDSKYED